jgi:hypothetical protein
MERAKWKKSELGHKRILCKETVVDSFKVSVQNLPGGTKESRQEFQTEEPASGPRIKPLTS